VELDPLDLDPVYLYLVELYPVFGSCEVRLCRVRP
jgi:hypothetical protein